MKLLRYHTISSSAKAGARCKMCGFVGIFSFNDRMIEPPELFSMCDLIAHRGPDDSGYLFLDTRNGRFASYKEKDRESATKAPPAAKLGMGHRRLSIIDLSDKASQPMKSGDGKIWLSFNGALYNYIELRQELKAAGYRFSSDSDTEVIIYAWRHWGEECLERFNGMWAIALWDSDRNQLFLSRDRMGIKPLYYHFQNGRFLFASEIKSILQAQGITREPEDTMVFDFLLWGIKDHTERTFFKNIHQLKPGEILCVSADGTSHLKHYYHLHFNRDIGRFNSNDETTAMETFDCLLRDSIKLRLRSDVPVGFCLSGGIDSSSIVCLADQIAAADQTGASPVSYRTFTFGNRERAFDERPFAAMVDREVFMKNHPILIDQERFWDSIDTVLWHQDEPFASTSIYAQYLVNKEVKINDTTVLLDGQGADELFAGYGGYYEQLLAQLAREGNVKSLLRKLKTGSRNMEVGQLKLLGRVLRILNTVATGPLTGRSRFRLQLANRKFVSDYADREELIKKKRAPGTVQERLFQDVTTFNLPQLLHYADRNSMAFAIEGRYPFLDYRVVEFALTLPAVYKLRDGCSKYILRKTMTGTVPQAILDRRDKMGFVTPEAEWIRNNMDAVRDLFETDSFRAERYIDVSKIRKSFDTLFTDRAISRLGLWKIIILEKWLRSFFS